MTNWDKYKDEILESVRPMCRMCELMHNYDGWCSGNCSEENKKAFAWMHQEYRPAPVKMCKFEFNILEYVLNKGYEWIGRDSKDELFVYVDYPYKLDDLWTSTRDWRSLEVFNDLFAFIKWDDAEPYNIEWLLNNNTYYLEGEQ